MLRALKFILIAAVFLAIAWWVGGLPGDVVARAGPYTVATSTPAALLLLFLIALLFTLVLRVVGGVRRAPRGVSAWRFGRRHKQGEAATQRAIVALAAGDAPQAQAQAIRARRLLGDTPLALLLSAESARLAGQDDAAKAAFSQLTTHREWAFLGHRGLLRHSMGRGEHDAAQNHALAAADAYPDSGWLRAKRLELEVAQKNWPGALALAQTPAQTAALATQAARESADNTRALAFAKQAVRANPALAPAVVALAQALRRLGKPRVARRALLAGWRVAPNPMIATLFLEPVTSPIERAQAAAELAAVNPGHAESELLLAQTALEARLTGEALRHAGAAMVGAQDGRAGNILNTLEGRPASQPVTAGWECAACHVVQPGWSAVCPQCGKLATLCWRAQPT